MSNRDKRALLSTLWVFVSLNVLFRDVHEFLRHGAIEEIGTGYLNGMALTESVLLLGGVMVELPLLMVVLARLLPNTFNRPVNIGMASISLALTATMQRNDLDDIFFAVAEIVGFAMIIGIAWTLRGGSAESRGKRTQPVAE